MLKAKLRRTRKDRALERVQPGKIEQMKIRILSWNVQWMKSLLKRQVILRKVKEVSGKNIDCLSLVETHMDEQVQIFNSRTF